MAKEIKRVSFEIEHYNGNGYMAFMLSIKEDGEVEVIKTSDCSLADVDGDYIFETDNDLYRIQADEPVSEITFNKIWDCYNEHEAYTEELEMNRVDNIVKFAQKREEEQMEKEISIAKQIEEYKETIKSFKPRIDELLKVGSACKKHGIKLTGKAWGGHEGYDTHQFMTNSWSHLLGFVYNGDNDFNCLGIFGGGACDFNLKTDGDFIEVEGNVLYILKRFVDEFDVFETEFYKYVDKVTE